VSANCAAALQLCALDLSRSHLPEVSVPALAAALVKLTALRELRVGVHTVGADGAGALLAALAAMKALSRLALAARVPDEALPTAARIAPACTALRSLRLALDRPDGVHTAGLQCAALASAPGLTELDLGGSSRTLGTAWAPHAVHRTLAPLTALESLSLSGVALGSMVAHLAP
jgi:hypothetical protein